MENDWRKLPRYRLMTAEEFAQLFSTTLANSVLKLTPAIDDAAVARAMAAEDEHRHSSREERVRAMLKEALG